jgi:organic radical activating enzyme
MNIDLEQKYLKRENLLILHLTDWCNNRCSFCMVKKIHGSFSFPYEEALSLMETLPIGSKVDLFGGEPTMHPDFFDILEYIYSKGLDCSVATNGRAFANLSFTQRAANITKGSLYVRTSLYGLTAIDHDRSTGVTGSYDELMSGIDHISAAKMTCQVNIVLTRKNIHNLEEITRLVASKKVEKIKFGLLIDCSSCIEIIPSLTDIRPRLVSAVNLSKDLGLKVTIEKAPLCLVPEYMNEFSSERELGQWSRFFDDNGECGGCMMRKWCDGLDPDYVNVFGTEGLGRIVKVPSTVLSPFPEQAENTNVRFLKLNLFRLPDGDFPEDRCEEIISAVIEEGRKKLARVAFVPDTLTCS